jgi:twitching motility protein PilU
MDIGYFLKLMAEKNASDMFLTSGAPVNIKVEGDLLPLGSAPLPTGMSKKVAYSLMNEAQIAEFERELELNMAIAVRRLRSLPRQRVHAARRSRHGDPRDPQRHPQHRGTAAAAGAEGHHHGPRGLVLIVGSTGSGKSTTLASMIDHRNSTSTGHILTIEDPIEYLHRTSCRSSTSARSGWTRTPSTPR